MMDANALGESLYGFVRELYPICRSITGPGLRETLAAIGRHVPLALCEVPSGTRVFDWEVPNEWSIREAWIRDGSGRTVVDFRDHNLRVVNYSTPVRARMSLADLKPHLHTIPERLDWIPYRTSYYRDSWGFCLTQRELDALPDGSYEVCIDSTLGPGSLTLGECHLPGQSRDEVLIYTHACHPSLCNDNLSALAVATWLATRLAGRGDKRLGHRFVFGPATIGSITWLAHNEDRVANLRHGLVLASLGDAGGFTYKRSRRGDTATDRAAEYVISRRGGRIEDFSPYGYDERQFCSPGFDLAVGRLTRTPNGRYPEYHTSADDLSFVSSRALAESLAACEEILGVLEENVCYVNQNPRCEPRLGPRGLFRTTGGTSPGEFEHALLWVLNQSDGTRDLLSIAERSRLDFSLIARAARALVDVDLLRPAPALGPR